MNILEQLRPETPPLDPEWSKVALQSILSSHSPSPRRRSLKGRRVRLAGATAAGILGIGGVAHATGLVPASITDFFEQTHSAHVTGVHEVASFTTSKSGTSHAFEIWRGTDADGLSCTAVLEVAARGEPDFGGNCGDYPTDAWFNTTSESWAGTINDPAPPLTYYVYGEPTLPGVARVRVTGDGFEHSVAVDSLTGGYALAIPELDRGVRGHFATVEFLDANDTVLGFRELSEK